MDFPIFHMDLIGDRMLIAIIAITHALISHSLAVGGITLIAYLEWKGYRKQDAQADQWAKRILFAFFIVTTSLGAMTGVGIWLSAALINPTAIGRPFLVEDRKMFVSDSPGDS